MINKKDLSKIGIGTWGIGGLAETDPNNNDERQINAIKYMIDNGFNFVEANLWYSKGKSVELLSEALKQSSKKRKDLFICQAVYIKNGDFKTAEREALSVLKAFNTDYIDTFQFTASVFYEFGFDRCAEFVENMISKGIFRYTSITNENLSLLQKYHNTFKDKLFSHEVGYNFEVRENEKEGTLSYANSNNIKTIVFQPLRRNRTANRNWPLLVDLAQKYGKSQNQIILAWLMSKGFLPLTKSENVDHINEHIEAVNIKLEVEDIDKIDQFKLNYVSPVIDWEKNGNGIDVSQLSNVFDEEYDKQQKI